MLKICCSTICSPLEIIFKEALSAVPIHKKANKQILKNYRPVSLFPICEKIFESYEKFSFSLENDVVLPNQSGIKSGDSCINQLLFITHEILQSFD